MVPKFHFNISIRSKVMTKRRKFTLLKILQFFFSRVLEMTPSQFFDIILSTNVSCHHKIFKKIRLEIREKFHFEIWATFDHPKIFNSVEFKVFYNAKLSDILWPLKQAIIQKNRWSLSKVMKNLVRPSIAGNAKKMPNWPTLPKNFSATAGTKKFEIDTKISFNTCTFRKHTFGWNREWSGKFCIDYFYSFPIQNRGRSFENRELFPN